MPGSLPLQQASAAADAAADVSLLLWCVDMAAVLLLFLQAFPASVLGIVLRGVCLMRPQEISWMFGGGAAALKPLGWGRFLQPLSAQERSNPLVAYYKRLLSPDAAVRSEAVSAGVWVG